MVSITTLSSSAARDEYVDGWNAVAAQSPAWSRVLFFNANIVHVSCRMDGSDTTSSMETKIQARMITVPAVLSAPTRADDAKGEVGDVETHVGECQERDAPE